MVGHEPSQMDATQDRRLERTLMGWCQPWWRQMCATLHPISILEQMQLGRPVVDWCALCIVVMVTNLPTSRKLKF